MTAAIRPDLISVEDYLAGERESSIKHEYLGGFVYAMAGANTPHNIIAMNASGMLHFRLRGKPCRPFNSDMLLRVQLGSRTRFYYPDVFVVCGQFLRKHSYQDEPSVIVEVLSKSTRRVDEGEKLEAYLTIPSLRVYLLVEQDEPLVVAYRRAGNGFVREVYQGLEAVVPLPELDTELPLVELYEVVQFGPEPEEDDVSGEY